MLEFLNDPNFLSALAAMVGPLAFFAAPTEEIEHLLFSQDVVLAEIAETHPDFAGADTGLAEAA